MRSTSSIWFQRFKEAVSFSFRLIGLMCSLVLIMLRSFGQDDRAEWLIGSGNDNWDIVCSITSDKQGNLFLAGSVLDTLRKGSNRTSEPNMKRSLRVVKYDSTGRVKWVHSPKGYFSDFGCFIAAGPQGTVFLVGMGLSESDYHMETPIRRCIHLSAINDAGCTIWSKQFPCDPLDRVNGFIVDTAARQLYIYGQFFSKLVFGQETLSSCGNGDGFIMQGNLAGLPVHVWHIGGHGKESMLHLTVLNNGNLLILGSFTGQIKLSDSCEIRGPDMQTTSIFSAEICSNNTINKGKELARGKQISFAAHATMDSEMIIALNFSDRIETLGKTFFSAGGRDILLVCCTNENQIKWSKQIGGIRKEVLADLVIVNDQILLTGSFRSSLDFDGFTLREPLGGSDILVAGLDKSGCAQWIRTFGGSEDDYPVSLALSKKEVIYLAGSFRGRFNRDSFFLSSQGEEDVFLARMSDCRSLFPVLPNPAHFCEDDSVTLDPGPDFLSYNWNNGQSLNQIFRTNTPGIVTLEVSMKNGCIAKGCDTIVKILKPKVNLGEDIAISLTDSVTLRIDSINGFCRWSNGATSWTLTLHGNELGIGVNNLSVFVEKVSGCSNADTVRIAVSQLDNVLNEYETPPQFIVYPNPTSGVVYIKGRSNQFSRWKLVDVVGCTVYSGFLGDCRDECITETDLSFLGNGVYLLLIENCASPYVFKIIKR